jgi:endonuclease/exonuclease/phosphatase family metal-dependent hydrolase
VADPLTVVSFNLRNGRAFDWCNSWPFRRRAAVAVLREQDADLIGLQEAYRFQLRYLTRRLGTYEAIGDGRDGEDHGEHTPVLSRLPVLGHTTRWFDVPGARFRRIATTATVAVGDGEVHFTSTHLDEASGARRRASVDQLLAWIAAEPGSHIVVGDFNATLDNSMFDAFADAGLRSALPDDAPGTSHHFSGRTDGRRIDHIFVPVDAVVLDAGVVTTRPGGRLPSDHWPVRARIQLPQ